MTKPGIIIDVVGSYFYEKIMTENGLFVLGGPEMHLHDILWAVQDGKNRGRSDGEQDAQCHMAQRYFCGDRQRVAETVVLYHRAPRHHLGCDF